MMSIFNKFLHEITNESPRGRHLSDFGLAVMFKVFSVISWDLDCVSVLFSSDQRSKDF